MVGYEGLGRCQPRLHWQQAASGTPRGLSCTPRQSRGLRADARSDDVGYDVGPMSRSARQTGTLAAVVLLAAAALLLPGCYRKEIRSRGWQGWRVDTGAEPAPQTQQVSMADMEPKQPFDPLGGAVNLIVSPFAAIGRGIGNVFSSKSQPTPPQPGGPSEGAQKPPATGPSTVPDDFFK
jgi:hypothetical protein